MPMFGLFAVRPPEGVVTVAAIREERLDDSVPRLKQMQAGGFLIKPLGKVAVAQDSKAEAKTALECHVRTMFLLAPRTPRVSVVW